MAPGGDAGPLATPCHSGVRAAPGLFLLLFSPGRWSLRGGHSQGRGAAVGIRVCPSPRPHCTSLGTPCAPLKSWCPPGPTVHPQCNNPEPLTVSPQPPRCAPCTCPHSPVCVPAAPRGLGMGGTKVTPSKAGRVGLGGIRRVWDHLDWGSLCSPSHSQGLRHFPHTPISAPEPGWQQERGCPQGFGAGRPRARGHNPVLDGFVSTSTRTHRDPGCEPRLSCPGGGRLGGCG